jgi:serine protease Do
VKLRHDIHDGTAIARPGSHVRTRALAASRSARADAHLRGGLVAAILLALLLTIIAAGAARAAADPSPFVDVGRQVRPAVVNIRITRSINSEGVGTGPLQEMFRQFFPDEEGRGGRFENPSTGSGFVVSASGDVLTNHHVISGGDAIFVRFSGEQKEYRATLVGTDPNTDLALLRIEPGERRLPVLEFGDSDALEVGAWAIAVGNPFGNLESTLTVGVVSAKGRGDLEIGGMTPRYQDFIQTDASINFGNSGGPLVDIEGRVVGVNTAISSRGQGIGFAVPSRLVQKIYAQLREHGRVIRGYLGVWSEDVVQVVGEEEPGLPDGGVRVLKVAEGSPAAAAGVRPGDVVVRFAGAEVESNRQLQFLIADAAPGRAVDLELIRDGAPLSLQATPIEWTAEMEVAAADRQVGWLGLDVADIAGGDARVERLKEALGVMATAGVMVVAVAEGEPAADAGIRPGDVLVSIEGREIRDLASFEEARTLLASQRTPLLLLVRTGGSERYVQVEPRHGGVEN